MRSLDLGSAFIAYAGDSPTRVQVCQVCADDMKSESKDSLAGDYASKPEEYFECPRSEMLEYVPSLCRRVLDVGCGTGSFGASLRRRTGCEVWGVESNAGSIPKAEENLDNVRHGHFGPELDLPSGYFDCIVFNDVLEHMPDPFSALVLARALLSIGGCVVASIPNIRQFPTVWKLVIGGDWQYQECGILDKTHLRFFTRLSIMRLFQGAGFAIQRIDGISPFLSHGGPGDTTLWRRYSLFSWLPITGIKDMRYQQFAIVAIVG
jgi:2-polyprenyl-3-methyl-5-hydroxy-6-metoxy-1,4-benzoquinol methylase